MSKRREKQSESLEVRLGYSAKEAFMEACREKGLTASEVVRDFVETYPAARRRRWSVSDIKLPESAMQLSTVLLLSAALGTSAILPTAATADRDDPEASFAEIDTDRDGYFTLSDLYLFAGMTEDGRMGDGLREQALSAMQTAIDDLDMLAQSAVLHPDFIDRTLHTAEEGASQGVRSAFEDIDGNGDGRVSRQEYLRHWENGSRHLGPSDPPGRD